MSTLTVPHIYRELAVVAQTKSGAYYAILNETVNGIPIAAYGDTPDAAIEQLVETDRRNNRLADRDLAPVCRDCGHHGTLRLYHGEDAHLHIHLRGGNWDDVPLECGRCDSTNVGLVPVPLLKETH